GVERRQARVEVDNLFFHTRRQGSTIMQERQSKPLYTGGTSDGNALSGRTHHSTGSRSPATGTSMARRHKNVGSLVGATFRCVQGRSHVRRGDAPRGSLPPISTRTRG